MIWSDWWAGFAAGCSFQLHRYWRWIETVMHVDMPRCCRCVECDPRWSTLPANWIVCIPTKVHTFHGACRSVHIAHGAHRSHCIPFTLNDILIAYRSQCILVITILNLSIRRMVRPADRHCTTVTVESTSSLRCEPLLKTNFRKFRIQI